MKATYKLTQKCSSVRMSERSQPKRRLHAYNFSIYIIKFKSGKTSPLYLSLTNASPWRVFGEEDKQVAKACQRSIPKHGVISHIDLLWDKELLCS